MHATLSPNEILRQYLEAMTHGKPGELTNLVTPDMVGIQGDQRIEGAEAVEAYAAHYRQLYPGWRFELEDTVVEGERIAARGLSIATIPATEDHPAEEKRLPWMAFYTLEGGRIAEARIISDPTALVARGRTLTIPLKP